MTEHDAEGLDWDAVNVLIRSAVNRLEPEAYAERLLIERWAMALVRAGHDGSLVFFRVMMRPRYGVDFGKGKRRRFFGLAEVREQLVIHARGAGQFAGEWYFGFDADNDFGSNHNGRPCSEFAGLDGADLVDAVLASVIAGQ